MLLRLKITGICRKQRHFPPPFPRRRAASRRKNTTACVPRPRSSQTRPLVASPAVMAAKSGFIPPRQCAEDSAPPTPSAALYVANCGPAVGVTEADVREAFGPFGEVVCVHAADDSGARVIVRFHEPAAAEAAMAALHGLPCGRLTGRVLHIRYSVPVKPKARASSSLPVAIAASDLGIPGIYMVEEFLTAAEEQELLAAVDSRPWKSLAKRRVQHYGYEFLYETRNVDSKQFLGELPAFVSTVLQKMVSFPGVRKCTTKLVDQLTVYLHI